MRIIQMYTFILKKLLPLEESWCFTLKRLLPLEEHVDMLKEYFPLGGVCVRHMYIYFF